MDIDELTFYFAEDCEEFNFFQDCLKEAIPAANDACGPTVPELPNAIRLDGKKHFGQMIGFVMDVTASSGLTNPA